MISQSYINLLPGEESSENQKNKEKDDHKVRESVETVTPHTENPLPGPDAEDQEQKSEK